MSIYLLKPALKETIWGGNRLKKEFGYESELKNIAEAWILSGHRDGESTVIGGSLDGKVLSEVLTKEDIGTHKPEFDDFPVLIKFIDAHDDLSIQVHPDDAYARANETDVRGKTEAWYILGAEPGACLIYGFKNKISREEFESSITDGTLLEKVNRVPVKKGDVVFIESGTLHAICKGVELVEVQQSCNTTYRVFDYNRLGIDGKPRQLHVKKAVDVTKPEPPKYDLKPAGKKVDEPYGSETVLMKCEYFTSTLLSLDGAARKTADETSFVSVIVLDGVCTIKSKDYSQNLKKGDSVLVTAGHGDFTLDGKAELLITTI